MRNPIALLALAGVAACGGSGATVSNPSPRLCQGEQIVVVTNDWKGTIDVLARIPGVARPPVLGTLPPGANSQIPVPKDATEIYSLQTGRDEPDAMTRQLRRFVRYKFECREDSAETSGAGLRTLRVALNLRLSRLEEASL
ncbi:MAG: hypothetical protein HOP28_12820 [Gemmatimonadales bacterium]|nr:hypothetical protein [Gemmatimonadales bacterium]